MATHNPQRTDGDYIECVTAHLQPAFLATALLLGLGTTVCRYRSRPHDGVAGFLVQSYCLFLCTSSPNRRRPATRQAPTPLPPPSALAPWAPPRSRLSPTWQFSRWQRLENPKRRGEAASAPGRAVTGNGGDPPAMRFVWGLQA